MLRSLSQGSERPSEMERAKPNGEADSALKMEQSSLSIYPYYPTNFIRLIKTTGYIE